MRRIRIRVGGRASIWPVALSLALLACGTTPAVTMKEIKTSAGYEDWNTLQSPVFDGTKIEPVQIGEITEAFDRAELVMRPTYGRWKGGLKSKLGPKADVGDAFTALVQAEAETMGLSAGEDGWRVNGRIIDFYVLNHLPSAWGGPILFYGFMEVELEVTSPSDETSVRRARFHTYAVGGHPFSGFARHLVISAQELLSVLNREYFKAPVHPSIHDRIQTLRRAGIHEHELDTHAIGLSGSPEAIPVFLNILREDEDEDHRSDAINALARIGSADAVSVLIERYDAEDDDPRWYTLKALGYIGTAEALDAVREKGLHDEQEYNRSLSERILRE